MSPRITLYTRGGCCLCEEMKEVVREVAGEIPLEVDVVDVDGDPELVQQYGDELPVLFVGGRKAFKYRVTVSELKRRLKREGR